MALKPLLLYDFVSVSDILNKITINALIEAYLYDVEQQ